MLPNILIRFFTGDSLPKNSIVSKQNSSFTPETQGFEDIIQAFHRNENTDYVDSDFAITLDRDDITVIPLVGESFNLKDKHKYDKDEEKARCVVNRKKELEKLSSNSAVINQLFRLLQNGAEGDPIALDLYVIGKTNANLRVGNSKLDNSYTIRQQLDGSLIVTKTAVRSIQSDVGIEALADNLKFYSTTVTFRISPKQVENDESPQAITTVELIGEKVNFDVLEEQKKQNEETLGLTKYNQIIQNLYNQQGYRTGKKQNNSEEDKKKALHNYACETLEAYTRDNKFIDVESCIKELKQLFTFIGFDKHSFISATIALSLIDPKEIEKLFDNNFTSLQLIKIYEKLNDLKNTGNAAALERIQLSIKNILQDDEHHVAVFKEEMPKELDKLEETNLNNIISEIKKEISSHKFFGRFHELKPGSSSFTNLIDKLKQLGQRLHDDNHKWRPIIKNIFSTYQFFSTTELCEINKSLLRRSAEQKDLKSISNLIVEILRDRGIQPKYFNLSDKQNRGESFISSVSNFFKPKAVVFPEIVQAKPEPDDTRSVTPSC